MFKDKYRMGNELQKRQTKHRALSINTSYAS